jgi:hypothetical protein
MKAYLKGAFFYFVAFTLPLALVLNLFITLLSDKVIQVSSQIRENMQTWKVGT